YRRALDEYGAAYETAKKPSLLYSIAKTHQKLGEFSEAYESYRRYLVEDHTLTPERRVQIEAKEAEALKQERVFDGLPPYLYRQQNRLAFVSLHSNNPDAKLQFLAATLEMDGWSWWTGPVQLEGEYWKTACKAPCNVPVARKPVYRISGEEIVSSEN